MPIILNVYMYDGILNNLCKIIDKTVKFPFIIVWTPLNMA
jgi:hypothetical protein